MAKENNPMDFLKEASNEVAKETDASSSPYSINRKETKTVRISADYYEVLRRIGFEEKRTITDVLNELIRYGFNNNDDFKQYKKYL